jgi:glycosyltransferase involved in cell wall biosynthesis
MNGKPTALLFSTVWPEPESSAAGVRQLQWVRFFQQAGFSVVLSSPSKLKVGKNSTSDSAANLANLKDVKLLSLPMNQSSIVDELKLLAPTIVMFDRFILEEQFGHFVYGACPEALVVLETEDLHFVRRARESVRENFLQMESLPPDFYKTETALRETASIERVDYAYLVSSFEESLLWEEFGISLAKVQWVPFTFNPIIEPAFEKFFSERADFSWVGNFRHAPNMDGLRWFLKEIWPRLRTELPQAKLNLYGAYPTAEVMGWEDASKGIVSHGPAKTLSEVFENARVNLAPLRFGAGVKGKILEGFRHGLPCVTTKVGVEGLLPANSIGDFEFPGIEANDPDTFVKACLELYQNEALWNQKRLDALKLLDGVYAEDQIFPNVLEQMNHLLLRKQQGELPSWNSKILRHELMNSHKYFSKWIEEKERK